MVQAITGNDALSNLMRVVEAARARNAVMTKTVRPAASAQPTFRVPGYTPAKAPGAATPAGAANFLRQPSLKPLLSVGQHFDAYA